MARHHVAHGAGPVYRSDGHMKLVDGITYGAWRTAARSAIIWMEVLSGGVVHSLIPLEENSTIRVNLSVD